MTYTEADLTATEFAILLCERAILNESSISSIEASDASRSYRSVPNAFTVDESAAIFNAAIAALQGRLTQIKAALGN
jgi:hypothetical protein